MEATRGNRDHPLWDRVDVIEDADSCWEWTGGSQRNRRSRMRFEGRDQYVYRIAWQLTIGPIPDGMYICHHCDNPPCCRPSHLFVGTHRDNMIDGLKKGIVTLPTNVPHGASHHDVTVPDELVAEVRELYAAGATQANLAQRYGVPTNRISRWVTGKVRRDAGGPISATRDRGQRRLATH